MDVMERMKQMAEKIRFKQHLESVENQYCENCRTDLRNELRRWVLYSSRFEGDDEPIQIHYCSRCIFVDASRRKVPEWRRGD